MLKCILVTLQPPTRSSTCSIRVVSIFLWETERLDLVTSWVPEPSFEPASECDSFGSKRSSWWFVRTWLTISGLLCSRGIEKGNSWMSHSALWVSISSLLRTEWITKGTSLEMVFASGFPSPSPVEFVLQMTTHTIARLWTENTTSISTKLGRFMRVDTVRRMGGVFVLPSLKRRWRTWRVLIHRLRSSGKCSGITRKRICFGLENRVAFVCFDSIVPYH